MKKQFFILLFLAIAIYGQEKVAIINTVDDGKPPIGYLELSHLTKKLRGIASNVLPKKNYTIMTEDYIIDISGSQEEAEKKCEEAGGCLAKFGREIKVHYIAQARIGRFAEDLTIAVELYDTRSSELLGSLEGEAKDVYGLISVLEEKAPYMFRKMPGVSGGSKISPLILEGYRDLQVSGNGYEFDDEKRYLTHLSTEPSGATLSFNGVPIDICSKTPCKVELPEGSVRILAALEHYETADTTISIKQNNQNINIKLKPNFGVLEIKPAYSENIGSGTGWSLAINGAGQSSYENRFSPGNYEVKLRHECYEDISFKAGINKGSREVFEMARHLNLKTGGLSLSAEKNGEPASEPVFVNGKQVGETPFSGSVPLCAKVEIGDGREVVDAKLKYNEKVKHTYKGSNIYTDSRDGKKYRVVKIGNQVWMAENLNYNANGSKCYDNIESNCQKYGRLYNWNTAKNACPKGWHLPSEAEWITLTDFGGVNNVGTKLKSASGWNNNGNGTDVYGFAALPGGFGVPAGFSNVGYEGIWWSASEYNANSAYDRFMKSDSENASLATPPKSSLLSIRCLQSSEIEVNVEKAITTTKVSASSFTDPRDKKTYKSVIIGTQTWMAKNLNYNANGSKCYDNSESNCQKYGRLYNWNTAMNVCPKGWHLPSDDEWGILMKSVNSACSPTGDCTNAGKLLKATSGYWNNNSGNGTDAYGFAALPGGGTFKGDFYDVSKFGYWWSASEVDTNYAYIRTMNCCSWFAFWSNSYKYSLLSVRCVKD
jgi:uncharacterized protein (TIGR02145 family)